VKVHEIWKDIPGYEDAYQASNLGRIRSLDRLSRAGKNLKGKIISQTKDPSGQCRARIYDEMKLVSRLIASAFLVSKVKYCVYHLNEIDDNRLENLEIVSPREITIRRSLSKRKKNKKTKFVGVFWNKRARKWRSTIYINMKAVYLGTFEKEIDAAMAYSRIWKNVG